MERPFLSIVIPAYNEEKRLPPTLKTLQNFFKDVSQREVEFIIVIEKSSDNTVAAANAALNDTGVWDDRFRIIANKVQKGKGFAVKTGMLEARGEVVLFMDTDLSTPLTEVSKTLAIFKAEPTVDCVIGSRAEQESQVLKKQKLPRQTLGRIFNHLVQTLGIQGIKDTQCGYKAFRKNCSDKVFALQTINGFAFDVEILLLTTRLGFKVAIQPVQWVNSAESKVRIWIDPLKMLYDLIRIRWIVSRTLRAQESI